MNSKQMNYFIHPSAETLGDMMP